LRSAYEKTGRTAHFAGLVKTMGRRTLTLGYSGRFGPPDGPFTPSNTARSVARFPVIRNLPALYGQQANILLLVASVAT